MRKPVVGMEQTLIGLAKAFSRCCFPASRLEIWRQGRPFRGLVHSLSQEVAQGALSAADVAGQGGDEAG